MNPCLFGLEMYNYSGEQCVSGVSTLLQAFCLSRDIFRLGGQTAVVPLHSFPSPTSTLTTNRTRAHWHIHTTTPQRLDGARQQCLRQDGIIRKDWLFGPYPAQSAGRPSGSLLGCSQVESWWRISLGKKVRKGWKGEKSLYSAILKNV